MYTDSQKENIAKNLNHFREVYKETHSDVVQSTKIGAGTYSDYVNRKSVPNRTNLRKLAAHYNITELELVNVPYWDSDFDFNSLRVNLFNHIVKIMPVINISDNKKDNYYFEAVKMHKQWLENFKNPRIKLDKIVSLYIESANKFDNYDSCANLMMILLLYDYAEYNSSLVDYFNFYRPTDDKGFDEFIKNTFLKYFDDPDEIEEFEEKEKDNIWRNYIETFLEILRSNKDYYDFIDYYIALEYLLGLGNTKIPLEYNHFVGTEMLNQLYRVDNKYAVDLVNYLEKILTSSGRS